MNQEKVGLFIKEIRKKNNLTQKEFAGKYNVTYQAVSNWEHGKNLPDLSLLKEISNDFNVSIDELLTGKKINKNHKNLLIVISVLILILLIVLISVISKSHSNNFEFKTLSSSCNDFKISGSISYNNKKTAIYISNINYCGGEDNTEYTKIDCILYELDGNKETIISNYKYDKKIKLEDFLKKLNFTIDDYSSTCKMFSNETLYLRIDALDKNNKTTTYKIPLSLNDTCHN